MSVPPINIKVGHDLPFDQTIELHLSVGWLEKTTMEEKKKLQEAVQNSTYVVTAWSGEKMIGLARCLSDDVTIFYLQSILVAPEYQRQGIGRKLLLNCLARFEHVRNKVLLTDGKEGLGRLYESLGYKNTRDLKKVQIDTYVQKVGLELE